jgi:peroxiredoxin
MRELREFAQRADEFEKLGVIVVGITVDGPEQTKKTWEAVANKRFRLLSDPDTEVIRRYGLLHAAGRGGEDIAIRATILVDGERRERWRRVSETVPDIPKADEVLRQVADALAPPERKGP